MGLSTLQKILKNHLEFLLITGDVISHSLTDSQWMRIKSLLSPENKYKIPDALNFATLILPETLIIPRKVVWFKKRELVVFHVAYQFHGWEGASCTEFLLRGPKCLLPLSCNMDGVTHQIYVPNHKDVEITNIYGIVTVEKTKTADTYNKLLDADWLKELLSDRNYYATINKSMILEYL